VLLIDDNPLVAGALADLLRDRGAIVETLHEAVDIVNAVERFKPDVVVLDYHLRETYGHEVHAQLRRRLPKLPVIIMSAAGPNVADLLQNGVTRFLAKPFEGDELIKTIHELIGPR
jgi:DNA-binding response OmpR family regulator